MTTESLCVTSEAASTSFSKAIELLETQSIASLVERAEEEGHPSDISKLGDCAGIAGYFRWIGDGEENFHIDLVGAPESCICAALASKCPFWHVCVGAGRCRDLVDA